MLVFQPEPMAPRARGLCRIGIRGSAAYPSAPTRMAAVSDVAPINVHPINRRYFGEGGRAERPRQTAQTGSAANGATDERRPACAATAKPARTASVSTAATPG